MARFEDDQLAALGILDAAFGEPLVGVVVPLQLLEREHGEVLGGGAGLPLGDEPVDPLEGVGGAAEHDLDLGQPEFDRRGRVLAVGEGLSVLLDRLAEVGRRPAGLVDLSAEQVERPFERPGKAALLDLLDHPGHDRLGVLGIARLDDRPRGPDQILRLQVPEPLGELEVLPSHRRLGVEDQGHAVARLGLGQVRKLVGGGLEMAQGGGAELGLLGPRQVARLGVGNQSRPFPGRSPPETGGRGPGTGCACTPGAP